MGHIGVGYMFKMLKFYFAIILLYTGSVKKKSALGTNQSEHGQVDAPTGGCLKGLNRRDLGGWQSVRTDHMHRRRDVEM